MSAAWMIPIIALAGLLQAVGTPMNGQLYKSLGNPWLSVFVSTLVPTGALLVLAIMLPRPLPSAEAIAAMPWWAPLGGVVGTAAVLASLLFVGQLGAGTVSATIIAASLIGSLAVDHFALLGNDPRPATLARIGGAALLIAGAGLIAKF